jgi:hypothetical protein
VIVAVAVDGARVAAWQHACIDALRDLENVVVRVVRPPKASPRAPGAFARRLGGAALAPVAVAFDATTFADADAVVDLTAGDAIAADPPLGVWRLRLGASNDPALPFAREIGRGAQTIEATLERRRGVVVETVRRGRFGVSPSYRATLKLALFQAARWPALAVAADSSALAGEPAAVHANGVSRGVRPFELMRFGGSLALRTAAMLAGQFFEVVEWNVGFIDGGPRAVLDGAPLAIRWLPRPRPMTFVADPFLVERDGLRVLFVEEFDYRRDRGVIDALVLDDAGAVVRRHRALELPTHLSYPYPIELNGELYLMPENCAANEAALYRCVHFPDRWERARAVFPATDAVDTTIFVHEGRWWALCTRWARGSNQALYAYHAPSIDGPWIAHAANPVVIDVASARPAGQPFSVDGVLYRPAQDCSRSYGCGLTIARIDALTPQVYRETVVRRHAAPTLGRYRDGIHTLNFSGTLGVVDGKFVRYDARKLAWATRKLGARVVRALARH